MRITEEGRTDFQETERDQTPDHGDDQGTEYDDELPDPHADRAENFLSRVQEGNLTRDEIRAYMDQACRTAGELTPRFDSESDILESMLAVDHHREFQERAQEFNLDRLLELRDGNDRNSDERAEFLTLLQQQAVLAQDAIEIARPLQWPGSDRARRSDEAVSQSWNALSEGAATTAAEDLPHHGDPPEGEFSLEKWQPLPKLEYPEDAHAEERMNAILREKAIQDFSVPQRHRDEDYDMASWLLAWKEERLAETIQNVEAHNQGRPTAEGFNPHAEYLTRERTVPSPENLATGYNEVNIRPLDLQTPHEEMTRYITERFETVLDQVRFRDTGYQATDFTKKMLEPFINQDLASTFPDHDPGEYFEFNFVGRFREGGEPDDRRMLSGDTRDAFNHAQTDYARTIRDAMMFQGTVNDVTMRDASQFALSYPRAAMSILRMEQFSQEAAERMADYPDRREDAGRIEGYDPMFLWSDGTEDNLKTLMALTDGFIRTDYIADHIDELGKWLFENADQRALADPDNLWKNCDWLPSTEPDETADSDHPAAAMLRLAGFDLRDALDNLKEIDSLQGNENRNPRFIPKWESYEKFREDGDDDPDQYRAYIWDRTQEEHYDDDAGKYPNERMTLRESIYSDALDQYKETLEPRKPGDVEDDQDRYREVALMFNADMEGAGFDPAMMEFIHDNHRQAALYDRVMRLLAHADYTVTTLSEAGLLGQTEV